MCAQQVVSLVCDVVTAVASAGTGGLVLVTLLRTPWQNHKKAKRLAQQCHDEAVRRYERESAPGEPVGLLADIENDIRDKKRRETGITYGLMDSRFDVCGDVKL